MLWSHFRPIAPETRCRLALLALLLVAAALTGCAKKEPAPSAPTLHSITGRVRLIGYPVHPDGRPTGETRVVDNADSVRVELIFGGRTIATAFTVDGVYQLTGVGPGGYIARAKVIEGFYDDVALTVPEQDIVAQDTLKLVAIGDLLPVPNPMAPDTRIYFETGVAGPVKITIQNMAGATVRTLSDRDYMPGPGSVLWDGHNQSGAFAPPGLYWVTYAQGADVRVHLLFK